MGNPFSINVIVSCGQYLCCWRRVLFTASIGHSQLTHDMSDWSFCNNTLAIDPVVLVSLNANVKGYYADLFSVISAVNLLSSIQNTERCLQKQTEIL